MMPSGPTLSGLVANLADVLDEEIALLTRRHGQLRELAGAIAARDDEPMERLLAEMEQLQQVQAATDRRLRHARRALAACFACDASELRLSRLIDRLSGEDRGRIEWRRRRIMVLVEDVRREHIRTAMLLTECARVNRELMETLFPASTPVTTYGTSGRESWRPHTGLVDTES
mgnify:CR=1 FL=1|jgi:flagellar biosynthesis/type III secretory pathway chaperone